MRKLEIDSIVHNHIQRSVEPWVSSLSPLKDANQSGCRENMQIINVCLYFHYYGIFDLNQAGKAYVGLAMYFPFLLKSNLQRILYPVVVDFGTFAN